MRAHLVILKTCVIVSFKVRNAKSGLNFDLFFLVHIIVELFGPEEERLYFFVYV